MRRYTELFKSAAVFRRMMNLWPPLWCQGIRITHIASDFTEIRVRLAFRWYNRNNYGTQFGGALFSMTDPFYSIMLLKNLGEEYTVWDRAASIVFLCPARQPVESSFLLSAEVLEGVRSQTKDGHGYVINLPVTINGLDGKRIASVTRTLHIQNRKHTGNYEADEFAS